MRRKQENWRAHLIVVAVVVLVMPVVLAGLLLWLATRAPMAEPRPHKTPSPNAFDYYMSAAKSIEDGSYFGFRNGSRTRRVSSSGWMSFRGRLREGTLAEKDAVLAKNREALDLFDKAIAQDCLVPRSSDTSSMFSYSSSARFRNLARLKCVQAQARGARSDWAGAANSALDVIKMGEDLRLGANLRESRTAMSNQSFGWSEMYEIVDHLNAREATAASLRLESIRSRHVPFTETLREEKWFTLAMMDYMWKRGDDDAPSGPAGERSRLSLSMPSSAFGKIVNRIQMRGVLKDLDDFIALSQKPFPLAQPVVRKQTQTRPQSVASSAMNYGTHWCSDLSSEAMNAILNVMLALRAYKLDHGKYPASLHDLAPFYIKKVPADPFAPSRPLQYVPTPKRFVLYSVGPDCRDDGGGAIKELSYGGRYGQFRVQAESAGDIVAGANTR